VPREPAREAEFLGASADAAPSGRDALIKDYTDSFTIRWERSGLSDLRPNTPDRIAINDKADGMTRRLEQLSRDVPIIREVGGDFGLRERWENPSLPIYEGMLQAYVEGSTFEKYNAQEQRYMREQFNREDFERQATTVVNELLKLGDRIADPPSRDQRTPEVLKDLLGIVAGVRDDLHLIGTNPMARDVLGLERHSSLVPESFRTDAEKYSNDLNTLWKSAKNDVLQDRTAKLEFESRVSDKLENALGSWMKSLKSGKRERIEKETTQLRDVLKGIEERTISFSRNRQPVRDVLLPTLQAIKWEVTAKLRELILPVR
jgi:hypothetical protein